MNKEINKLLKDLLKDPMDTADKFNDENYKKVLPKKVYEWHKRYKGDNLWSEYIINVLIENYQINNSDIGYFG